MKHTPRLLVRLVPASLLTLAILLTAGCGEPSGFVTGKITVNGKPLPRGLITFLPEGGNKDPFSSAIVNGAYRTNPMPVGPAKIMIVPTLTAVEKGPPEETGGNDRIPKPKLNKAARKKDPFDIPLLFQNADTSGLQITVEKGENTFDKDIKP